MTILVLLTLFSMFLLGVLSTNQLIRPPAAGTSGDKPTYYLGDEVQVEWEKELPQVDIYIWRQNLSSSSEPAIWDQLIKNTTLPSYPWTISTSGNSIIQEDEAYAYWLSMYKPSIDGPIAESRYFNVRVKKSSDAASTTTSTAESDTKATSSATSTSTSSSTPTETSEPSSNGGHTLSTGAVAGIAVGATIGGILLLAGVAFAIWKYARGTKAPSNPPHMYNVKDEGQKTMSPELSSPMTEHRSELEARTHTEAPGHDLYRP